MTNEDPTNLNQIVLFYLKNILLGSTTAPTESATYKIGDPGLYFVKSLMNDPTNSYIAYLFTTDNNVASGTFGVFKMDFTTSTPNYGYTAFTMSSGLAFSVNSLIRTSLTDANDFLFAGKVKSLTDGTTTQTFTTSYGYVMKGKTSDSTKNCFNFPSGYSLSL
jgi:hypothetical protein